MSRRVGRGDYIFAEGKYYWFLGEGSFNRAYSSTSIPCEVLKVAKHSIGSHPVNSPAHSVSVWNEINPDYPARETQVEYDEAIHNAWICPFIPGKRPSTEEICQTIMEIYERTDRIVIDGYVPDNFVKMRDGRIICIDIGLALKLDPTSPTSKAYFESHEMVRIYSESLRTHNDRKTIDARITQLIRALLYLAIYQPSHITLPDLKTNKRLIEQLAALFDTKTLGIFSLGAENGPAFAISASREFPLVKHTPFLHQEITRSLRKVSLNTTVELSHFFETTTADTESLESREQTIVDFVNAVNIILPGLPESFQSGYDLIAQNATDLAFAHQRLAAIQPPLLEYEDGNLLGDQINRWHNALYEHASDHSDLIDRALAETAYTLIEDQATLIIQHAINGKEQEAVTQRILQSLELDEDERVTILHIIPTEPSKELRRFSLRIEKKLYDPSQPNGAITSHPEKFVVITTPNSSDTGSAKQITVMTTAVTNYLYKYPTQSLRDIQQFIDTLLLVPAATYCRTPTEMHILLAQKPETILPAYPSIKDVLVYLSSKIGVLQAEYLLRSAQGAHFTNRFAFPFFTGYSAGEKQIAVHHLKIDIDKLLSDISQRKRVPGIVVMDKLDKHTETNSPLRHDRIGKLLEEAKKIIANRIMYEDRMDVQHARNFF